MALRLFSTDVAEGSTLSSKQVFHGFGHSGENLSPQLAWEGAPEGTKSFVLTMYDPDAPTGSGFWHWIVVDIPASAHELTGGIEQQGTALPEGARQARNDFGMQAFAGAAPPPGPAHRYIFTLRALSVDKLPVPDDASGAFVGFLAGMHTLETATLTAHYGVS